MAQAQEPILLDTVNPLAHARALRCAQGLVYLGDNLGRCFSYNPNTSELHALNRQNPEIRDVEVNQCGVLWMQTGDSGKVFRHTNYEPILFPRPEGKSVFFDGIAVKDSLVFAMGDPANGEFQVYLSYNFGKQWIQVRGLNAFEGEAAFAASGTTVQILDKTLYFVSGGTHSRIMIGKKRGKRWKSYTIPFLSGEGEGAYSFCAIDRKHFVVVGGNYQFPDRRSKVCFTSTNGGKTWRESTVPPMGYRSCVIHFQGVTFACGTNGLDFSTDGGQHWTAWHKGNFLSMDVSRDERLWITLNRNLGLFPLEPVRKAVLIKN
ncbi:MAG: hypothetical protein FJZ80_07325 [Bacteroidetes bacterium]|nr:hypothetical protein [Bacteroidota bacterium]